MGQKSCVRRAVLTYTHHNPRCNCSGCEHKLIQARNSTRRHNFLVALECDTGSSWYEYSRYVSAPRCSRSLANMGTCSPPAAVIISCLSSFPQLFSQGKTKKQKPVWTPTDTYYQRLKLRMRAAPKESAASQDRSSIISMPAQPSPELNSSRGLNVQHTQYTVSFDSLEMQPERLEQISQPHQAEQVDVVMPQTTYQQDSLTVSSFGTWPETDAELPEKNQITKHVTYSVTTEPAELYCHNHQEHV